MKNADNLMEIKKYSQYGTFMVVVMLSILLFFMIIFFKTGFFPGSEAVIPLLFTLIVVLCLLLFYKITIYIHDLTLSFKMGIGLFGRSYKLSEIKSCKPVRNSVFLGFGIHMLWNGWIYNVSGLKAIELSFYNKSSVVRIGTDRPEEISEVVNQLIGRQETYETDTPLKRKRVNWRVIVMVATILIVIALILSGNKETKVKADLNGITIKGIYGLTIPYNDVLQIDTVSSLPRISLRTNGYAFGRTNTGNFRLANKQQVKLFIKVGYPPYILIKSKDRVPIYLNFEDKQKTINLYKDLEDKKH